MQLLFPNSLLRDPVLTEFNVLLFSLCFNFVVLNLQVLQFLPAKSLSCKTVVKKSAPSMEAFLREHFLCGSPVIISDCMTHWPARKKWNDMDYLKRVAGDRTVPVEVISLPPLRMKFK